MKYNLIEAPVVELIYRKKGSKKHKIESPADIHALLVPPLEDTLEHHTSSIILLLNGKNQVLGVSSTGEGTLTYSITDVRFILQLAILSNCKGIVVCINNPSCEIEPSSLDDELKDQIKIALSYFDVDLIDYFLYNPEEYYSYAIMNKL